jgi:hypothetical protein
MFEEEQRKTVSILTVQRVHGVLSDSHENYKIALKKFDLVLVSTCFAMKFLWFYF